MSEKINLLKASSEEILSLFEDEFEKKASFENIDSFDAVCTRDLSTLKVLINVTIFGTAGSPTIDMFKNNKIESLRDINITRYDIGSLNLKLLVNKTVMLNSNDFMIVYESI